MIYLRYKDLSLLQSVLACLRPVIVALILGAGLSVLRLVIWNTGPMTASGIDWIGAGSFLAAFLVLRRCKWNPILTMCLCGIAGLVLNLL